MKKRFIALAAASAAAILAVSGTQAQDKMVEVKLQLKCSRRLNLRASWLPKKKAISRLRDWT